MRTDTTPPTLWSIARRPRWIAALVLALTLAAGFAALGQWQLERGVASAIVIERDTETVKPLADITTPQQPTNTIADGQLVEVEGEFDPRSWIVLSGRSDRTEAGGSDGAWVVGRFITDVSGGSESASESESEPESASVAVAVGWAPTVADAASVADALDDAGTRDALVAATKITGRYLPGEPPQLDDFELGELSSLSLPALVNLWPGDAQAVYGGYIVPQASAEGLAPISAPAPTPNLQLNWLNIFYAVEWAVFAVFAVYMWFRLVKDAWERETDPGEDPDADGGASGTSGTGSTGRTGGASGAPALQSQTAPPANSEPTQAPSSAPVN